MTKKELMDELGRLQKVCRDATVEAKSNPEKKAECNRKFDEAFADLKKTKEQYDEIVKQEKREEHEKELDEFDKFMNQPAEKLLHRASSETTEKEKFAAAHKEAFVSYLRSGESEACKVMESHGLKAREMHTLVGTQSDLGGFLVPPDFRAEVIKELATLSTFRRLAREVPTSSDRVIFPTIAGATGNRAGKYPSGFAGDWKAQGQGGDGSAPSTQDQPTFGQEEIPVHIWQPNAVVFSRELMEDSVAPVERMLIEIIAETMALDLEDKGVTGTGVNEPEGIKNAGLSTVNSGGASTLTYSGLVDLMTGLPSQYRSRATWVMNSGTYGTILQLEDTAGNNIIPPNSMPMTLFGRPIEFNEFMDAVGSSNKPIVFGDFNSYVFAVRSEMRIQRLMERFAPSIGILPTARIGGQVVRTQAFRLQNVSS